MFKTASDANDETHLYTRRYFVSSSRIDWHQHTPADSALPTIAGENARARPIYVAAAVVASVIRVECVEHVRLSGLRPIHAYWQSARHINDAENISMNSVGCSQHLIRAWIWRYRIDVLCSLVLPPRTLHNHTSIERRAENPVFYRNERNNGIERFSWNINKFAFLISFIAAVV